MTQAGFHTDFTFPHGLPYYPMYQTNVYTDIYNILLLCLLWDNYPDNCEAN